MMQLIDSLSKELAHLSTPFQPAIGHFRQSSPQAGSHKVSKLQRRILLTYSIVAALTKNGSSIDIILEASTVQTETTAKKN